MPAPTLGQHNKEIYVEGLGYTHARSWSVLQADRLDLMANADSERDALSPTLSRGERGLAGCRLRASGCWTRLTSSHCLMRVGCWLIWALR